MKTEQRTKVPSLRYDLILIGALLVVSVGMLLVTTLTRRDGSYVEVEKNGEILATYRLSQSGEYSLNGGTNVLVIEDGMAYLKEANCPDKTCVRTGKIRYVGQSIVCLPNDIAITVRGNSKDGVDIVS
jgi:hypothetical protein